MEAETVVKKWGGSLAVVLPKELVDNTHVGENDKVIISVRKEADLRGMFGSLKTKMTGQEFKDLVRKGWDNGS